MTLNLDLCTVVVHIAELHVSIAVQKLCTLWLVCRIQATSYTLYYLNGVVSATCMALVQSYQSSNSFSKPRYRVLSTILPVVLVLNVIMQVRLNTNLTSVCIVRAQSLQRSTFGSSSTCSVLQYYRIAARKLKLQKFLLEGLETYPQKFIPVQISCYTVCGDDAWMYLSLYVLGQSVKIDMSLWLIENHCTQKIFKGQ